MIQTAWYCSKQRQTHQQHRERDCENTPDFGQMICHQVAKNNSIVKEMYSQYCGNIEYPYGRKINLPTASYVVLSTVDLKAHELKCKSHTYKTLDLTMEKSFILG